MPALGHLARRVVLEYRDPVGLRLVVVAGDRAARERLRGRRRSNIAWSPRIQRTACWSGVHARRTVAAPSLPGMLARALDQLLVARAKHGDEAAALGRRTSGCRHGSLRAVDRDRGRRRSVGVGFRSGAQHRGAGLVAAQVAQALGAAVGDRAAERRRRCRRSRSPGAPRPSSPGRPAGCRDAAGRSTPRRAGSSSADTTSAVATPPPIPRTAATRGATTRARIGEPRRSPSAAPAIWVSSSRIRASGSRALCGVELIRPNAACAIARALSGRNPACTSRSRPAQRSTYSRCRRRTCSRASSGSDSQSRSWTTISGRSRRAKSTCHSTRATRAAARVGSGLGPLATDLEEPLADRDQHLGEHRVLGREVLVERRPGDPAGRADVGDAHPVEAARREQLRRGREDLLAARKLLGRHGTRLAVANPGAGVRQEAALPPRPGRGRRPCRGP